MSMLQGKIQIVAEVKINLQIQMFSGGEKRKSWISMLLVTVDRDKNCMLLELEWMKRHVKD